MAVKILIVEDDPTISESLNALLTAKGYLVSTAGDGAEAVALARREKPQLMLLDVILPKMGGIDVCQILKKDPNTKDIKIVMITALGRMGDVEAAFTGGADDYLIKPFESQRLFKKIDKVING